MSAWETVECTICGQLFTRPVTNSAYANPRQTCTDDCRIKLNRKLRIDELSLAHQRGGRATHKAHPEHAKTAGSRGGQAVVAKRPEMKTPEWGRKLVEARERKRELRKSDDDVKLAVRVARVCEPLSLAIRRSYAKIDSCTVCGSPPYGEQCNFVKLLDSLDQGDRQWYLEARSQLHLLRSLLRDPSLLRSAREAFAAQKTSQP